MQHTCTLCHSVNTSYNVRKQSEHEAVTKIKIRLDSFEKEEKQTITCPHYPDYLNTKCNHTTGHVEAIDGTKVRELECRPFNKFRISLGLRTTYHAKSSETIVC